MGRRSSRELVQQIGEALEARPKSIQEIADEIGADWKAVERYLDSLAAAGIADEEQSGRSRLFSLANPQRDRDTYFGLPLTDEQREASHSLFARIENVWQERTGDLPSRTQVQKVAVDVLKHHDLNIPHGWYLYGSITTCVYEPGNTYTDSGSLGDEVEESVDDSVDRYAEYDSFDEIRLKQYRDEEKHLYLAKESILALLTSYKQLQRSVQDLEEALERFLSHLPPIDDPQTEEVITDFAATVPQLIREADETEAVQRHCMAITDVFHTLWDLIALYQLYDDLQDYYDEEELDARLGWEKDERRDESIEAVSTLVDRLQPRKEPDNPMFQQIKHLQGAAEELSEKEQAARKEGLDGMNSSDLFRKLDIESGE